MKYPFLLAALLLCSANLAARHSDTDTLLQPDTLSLRQSDALSAQKSDAPFVRPPYLRPGDTIGIVTPARKLKEKADTAKVRERFEEWGLKVKFGAHYADREQPYFAGTDARRAAYYNYYSSGTWGMAETYDLCIDSSVLGIDGTTGFVLEFVERKLGVKP